MTSFDYSLPEIIELLVRQYKAAPYGLLSCEPNWIYPVCNIITASAIRAADAQYGTRHWDAIADRFRHHLETDFTSADGRLLAFRSGLTGLGTAMPGGAMVQALPCLFLNAIFPDLARRQWRRVRHHLTGPRHRRHLWPIDVGNYRLSRAASYAAIAAAAVEMGDGEVANRLLDLLDAEHPSQWIDGIAHRSRASLWAHAFELIARLGRADGLRTLVTQPRTASRATPHIKSADYPDVLVAEARAERGSLRAVLHTGTAAGDKALTIAGLVPMTAYVAETGSAHPFVSSPDGEAALRIPVRDRTALRIVPAA